MKAVVSELVDAASNARRGRVAEARGDVLQPERVVGEASYLEDDAPRAAEVRDVDLETPRELGSRRVLGLAKASVCGRNAVLLEASAR
jgi:hypothetical protein